jgi:hypothetical protein
MPVEMDKHLYVYTCARRQLEFRNGWMRKEGGDVNVDVEYKLATMLPCLQKKRGGVCKR